MASLKTTCIDLLIPLFRFFYLKKVVGIENLPAKPFIIAANHPSGIDPVAILAALKRKIIFIVAKWIFKGDILSKAKYLLFIRLYEGIPTGRATKKIVRALKKGQIIALFPQGRITYDTKLLPAQTGTVVSAIMAKVPIVPIGISGTDKMWPTYKPFITFRGFFRFKRIKMVIGEPLYLEMYYNKKLKKKLLDSLTKNLMKEIGQLIKKTRKLK